MLSSQAAHARVNAGGFTLQGTRFEIAGAAHGIDPLLAYSIALLESGFGHGKGSVAPWHWTLRAPSAAFYLDGRRDAEAKLQELLRVSSIVDVGAMQINLRWNGHRAARATDLLDPATNIDVGTAILAEAISSAPGNLQLGIGRYHNWTDSVRALNYGARALAVYSNLRTLATRARRQEPGARSQEPGARSQEPGARSQEPGARSQEPGARSHYTMMYGFDEALELEAKALQINTPGEDRIARALDAQLWQLLQVACQHNPDDACHVFGISPVTAAVIANASSEKLSELICGAVLSFHIKNMKDLAEKIESALASEQPGPSKLIADYSPELRYWQAVQIMALRDPHLAHGRTGIPTDLLMLIQSADEWQLRQLASSGSEFGFSCTEKIIVDILTESRPHLLTQMRLKKVQQCLTSRGETSSCNVPPPCNTVRSLHRELIGRLMLISGFVTRVIELETGLSYKQITKIQAQIKAAGIKMNKPKSRALKSSGSIVYNYSSKIQASLLMQLYVNIGWQDVYQNTNVNALLRAYRIYGELREEIPGMKTAKWEPLDINAAWGLTAELRRSADAGMMNYCKHCNCSYFTTASQRTFIECPYCHDKPSTEEISEYQRAPVLSTFCSQKKESLMAPTLRKKDPEKRKRRPLKPGPILKPIKSKNFTRFKSIKPNIRISTH